VNRERFPGVDAWARLDGPAGSLMVDAAIDAMADWMRSGQGANHGGAFAAAEATDVLTEAARTEVAALLGGEAVVFGPSMTALTMRFARTVITPGDEVVCTRLDHDANVRPWVLAGADVRFVDPSPTLELSAEAVQEQLTERTRWVAVTGASNAVGTVPFTAEIASVVHDVGARLFIDAVHAVPHRPIDASVADVVACSAYKWFGPHVGVLCASRALLEEFAPDKLIPSPDEVPDRYELGTLPFESLAGVQAAAAYLRSLDWAAVRAHEDALLARALDGLGALDGVTLYGAAADRTPTLMFNVAGLTSRETAGALAAEQIAVWHGNYYAHELEQHLGLAPDGAVRAGFLHYNEPAEADRLVAAVERLTSR
jgi:cysteine desulfurase family protein (TIGR01976 family)